nr:MAG TPA: hypothetical protein [Caudoviricetes sp.]DAT86077.1 MAG TPA: hypothetical protein [Caudoviricetes sp.]
MRFHELAVYNSYNVFQSIVVPFLVKVSFIDPNSKKYYAYLE